MVEVLYMDGSSEKLTGANIKYGDPPGCYIATAVYGSYDCPQVWTLRRFRDHTLAASWYGRTFLHAYYAVSPTLVKWFGRTAWFQKLWRAVVVTDKDGVPVVTQPARAKVLVEVPVTYLRKNRSFRIIL